LISPFTVTIKIKPTDLDGSQILNVKRVVVLFNGVVRQGHFSPNTSFEKSIIIPVKLLTNRNALRVEVLQGCPVALFLFDIPNVYLVNEPVLAFGRYLRLCRIRFIGLDIVVLQTGYHGLHA